MVLQTGLEPVLYGLKGSLRIVAALPQGREP